jgi:MYXO-CTERM domain-containing protein
VCGLGFVEDPGSCDDGSGDGAGDGDGGGVGGGDDGAPVPDLNGPDLADQAGKEPGGCAYGCASGGPGGPGSIAGLVALGALVFGRRRRAAGR